MHGIRKSLRLAIQHGFFGLILALNAAGQAPRPAIDPLDPLNQLLPPLPAPPPPPLPPSAPATTPRNPPPDLPPNPAPDRPATTPQADVTATAEFKPSTIPLMRFGNYHVVIYGVREEEVELPDSLPVPNGLVVQFSQKTTGFVIQKGQRVDTLTLQYSVTGNPGSYLMPSFTVRVRGAAVTVPASRVVVQEPNALSQRYQSAHAAIDLPKGEYYVGQVLPARLLIFDTADETVQAVSNITKPSGEFLFQSQQGSRREQVQWEGRTTTAMVTPLRLTPIKPGETEVSIQAIVFVTKMSSIGRPGGNTAQAMLDTPPVRVNVRPLPVEGRKPGFTGGIGTFSLNRPTTSATEVKVGDPVTLTVTITGEGNLEAITPPEAGDSEHWQSFTPTTEVTRDVMSARGNKTITYTMIPRTADTRSLPTIPFSVFDPERGEFVDLSIPPVPITVKPLENAASVDGDSGKAVSAEPRAIKPAEPILTGLAEKAGSPRKSPSPVAWSAGFWVAQLFPAGGLLGLWLWRRNLAYLAAHPEVVRRRAARAAARKHLHRARSAAQQRDSDGFVNASIDAIRAAASPLDSTKAESLVLSEVLSALPSEADATKADTTVRQLFERSHAVRFSGHEYASDGVFGLLPEVERTVATIEKHQP